MLITSNVGGRLSFSGACFDPRREGEEARERQGRLEFQEDFLLLSLFLGHQVEACGMAFAVEEGDRLSAFCKSKALEQQQQQRQQSTNPKVAQMPGRRPGGCFALGLLLPQRAPPPRASPGSGFSPASLPARQGWAVRAKQRPLQSRREKPAPVGWASQLPPAPRVKAQGEQQRRFPLLAGHHVCCQLSTLPFDSEPARKVETMGASNRSSLKVGSHLSRLLMGRGWAGEGAG